MKKYVLKNFFKIYTFKFLKIYYITQNKEEKSPKNNSCVVDLIRQNEGYNFFEEHKGIFIAITNDMIINHLKRMNNIKVTDITMEKLLTKIHANSLKKYFARAKIDVNGLKKHLIGDNTLCKECEKKESCTARKLIGTKTEKMKAHFVIIRTIKNN